MEGTVQDPPRCSQRAPPLQKIPGRSFRQIEPAAAPGKAQRAQPSEGLALCVRFQELPARSSGAPPPPNSYSWSWFQPARFTVHKSHAFPPWVAAFTTRTSSRAACLVYFMFRKQQIPPPSPSHSLLVPPPLNRVAQNLQTFFVPSLSLRVPTSLANLLS